MENTDKKEARLNIGNIMKLYKQAEGITLKIEGLILKRGDVYNLMLVEFAVGGITWDNIFSTFVDLFPDWPKDEKGKAKGAQRVFKEHPDYIPARVVWNFNQHRTSLFKGYTLEADGKVSLISKEGRETEQERRHRVAKELKEAGFVEMGAKGEEGTPDFRAATEPSASTVSWLETEAKKIGKSLTDVIETAKAIEKPLRDAMEHLKEVTEKENQRKTSAAHIIDVNRLRMDFREIVTFARRVENHRAADLLGEAYEALMLGNRMEIEDITDAQVLLPSSEEAAVVH